jgi:hypothetical protein
MTNKRWGVINTRGGTLDGKMAYPIEWCDTLQQAYSGVMEGYATDKTTLAIVKIYQITDVEIKEK